MKMTIYIAHILVVIIIFINASTLVISDIYRIFKFLVDDIFPEECTGSLYFRDFLAALSTLSSLSHSRTTDAVRISSTLVCTLLRYFLSFATRCHPLSTYAKFSVRVRIRGLEILVFREILRTMDGPPTALVSWL